MHEDATSVSLPLDTLQRWAKAAPKAPGGPFHPLTCHLIYVGAVTEAMGGVMALSSVVRLRVE